MKEHAFLSKIAAILMESLEIQKRKHSGSEVECLTRDGGAAGSSITGVTMLCPEARHIYPCFVLFQHRKTRSDIAESLLTGT